MPRTGIVTVEPQDGLDEIEGKLLQKVEEGCARIELIVQAGNRALSAMAGCARLQQLAASQGIELSLYTPDEKVFNAATLAGLDALQISEEMPAVEVQEESEPPAPSERSTPAEEELSPERRAQLEALSEEDLAWFEGLEALSALEEEAEEAPSPSADEGAPDVGLPEERREALREAMEAFLEEPEPPDLSPEDRAFLLEAEGEEVPSQKSRGARIPWRPRFRRPRRETAEPRAPSRPARPRVGLVQALRNVGGMAAMVWSFYLWPALRRRLRLPSRPTPKERGKRAPEPVGEVSPTQRARLRQRYRLAMAGTFLALAFLALLFALLLPSATLVVVPQPAEVKTLEVALPLQLGGATASVAKGEGGAVPAREVRVPLQAQAAVPTTGYNLVPEGRATGSVVFTNRTGQSLTVPANTILIAQNGVRFQTLETVVVPPSDFIGSDAQVGKAVVQIAALEPGSKGNVDVAAIQQIDGPLAESLWVVNEVPTTGGSEREVRFVTEEDDQALKEELTRILKGQLEAALLQQLNPSEVLVGGSLRLENLVITTNASVGQEAQVLEGTASAQGVGLAVLREEELRAVEVRLRRVLEASKGPAGRPDLQRLEVLGKRVEAREGGQVEVVEIRVPFLPTVEPEILRELRGRLRGRSLAEAREVLEQARETFGFREAYLDLDRAWLRRDRLPLFSWQIQVQVEGE